MHHLNMVLSCEERLTEVLREGRQRPISKDLYSTGRPSDRDYEAMQQYVDDVEDFGKWEAAFKRDNTWGTLRRSDTDFPNRAEPTTDTGREQLLRQYHAEIVVAWYTMIFRGICWYQLHELVPGLRIGSQYWDTQQSVYIT